MPKRSYESATGSVLSSYYRAPPPSRFGPPVRGRVARARVPATPRHGALSAGYTRRSGFYGRFNQMGNDPPGELKFLDVDLDDGVVASAGSVIASINLIPQGATESQRVGRKCTIRAISCRYRCVLPQIDAAATPGNGDTCRFIVFQDKQCNGATATVTGILESANYKSFYNLANQGRFKILEDSLIQQNFNGLASDGAGVVSSGMVQEDHIWKKAVTIPVEFDGATGAITEIRSNNVGVLLISTAGTTNFNSKFRIRFSDN